MKNLFYSLLAFLLTFTFAGSGTVQADLIWPIPESVPAGEEYEIDYLVLVNKENALPETWEDEMEIVHMTNSLGDDVEVEKKAYDAYLNLKEALAAEDDVHIDLDSAYRSVAEQQRIVEDFTERYGEDYVKQYVAVPGFSEQDMVNYPEVWSKIHAKLADHGYILRYPEGKEDITGYSYEPWHIRYLDDPELAREITEQGLTLEEYLQK